MTTRMPGCSIPRQTTIATTRTWIDDFGGDNDSDFA